MGTPAQPWFLEVVHVTSRAKQQEVLTLLGGVAGLTTMGVSSGRDQFVVVGAVDNLMKSAARVLISDIDPDAVLTYNSDAAPLGRITPGYPSGAWAESPN
ncbi:MAG TPA: hypothetical protein VNP97_00130 [Microbacterium sp.]|nr:hypothetical protein [Microbacterium sp.]